MFHLFYGKVKEIDGQIFLVNEVMGIEVLYQGHQENSEQVPSGLKQSSRQGEFYLYPYMDDQHKTISYFAFDTYQQKKLFLMFYKIQGIGPKTAYSLTAIPPQTLERAVEEFDTKVLTAIPGVGPKTAKRLLVELKTKLKKTDIAKINADDTLIKQIIKTLTTMGYSKEKVVSQLEKYDGTVTKESMQDVVVWLVQHL